MPPKGRYVPKNTREPAKTAEPIKKPPSRYENFPAGLIPAEEWLRFRITIVTLLVHRALNAEFNTHYSTLKGVIGHIEERNAFPLPIVNLLKGLNKMNNVTKHESTPIYGKTLRDFMPPTPTWYPPQNVASYLVTGTANDIPHQFEKLIDGGKFREVDNIDSVPSLVSSVLELIMNIKNMMAHLPPNVRQGTTAGQPL